MLLALTADFVSVNQESSVTRSEGADPLLQLSDPRPPRTSNGPYAHALYADFGLNRQESDPPFVRLYSDRLPGLQVDRYHHSADQLAHHPIRLVRDHECYDGDDDDDDGDDDGL
jgi:hypothetical protein